MDDTVRLIGNSWLIVDTVGFRARARGCVFVRDLMQSRSHGPSLSYRPEQ